MKIQPNKGLKRHRLHIIDTKKSTKAMVSSNV